jgi:hypothetical protein
MGSLKVESYRYGTITCEARPLGRLVNRWVWAAPFVDAANSVKANNRTKKNIEARILRDFPL